MREKFEDINFARRSLELIAYSITILAEYTRMGYKLTVRQLYYQLVARDIIPNSQKSYKSIVDLIGRARKAGLVDWDAIEDRGRNMVKAATWENAGEILNAAAMGFRLDPWEDQHYAPIVMVEKDALVNVVGRVCNTYRVPYMANRGYLSLSEVYALAKRLIALEEEGKTPMLFYLGDHDPSGLDMDRDLVERLELFTNGCDIQFRRLALTMAQIEEYNPPENPAKFTDSRIEAYVAEHGTSSWELDALPPNVLGDLVTAAIESVIDRDAWSEVMDDEQAQRERLLEFAGQWE